MPCICGVGESTETHCGPILKGERAAETAEALMRSRYAAYALGEVDYILDTLHPEHRQDVDRAATEAWSKNAKWNFARHNGRWYFVDGETIGQKPVVREGPRIGRNDPCPCGSGKKYKKCCGKAAA